MKLPGTIYREDLAPYKAEHSTLSTTEVATKFREAIRSYGLEPPEVTEPGKWHRFPGLGKGPTNRSAWCRLFHDEQGGAFGDWSTGLSEKWFANGKPVSSEKERRGLEAAQALQEAEWAKNELQKSQAEKEAQELWDRAQTAPATHPYLKKKQIKPHNLRATSKGELLAPVYDRDDKLSSVQRVFEKEGKFEKRFLSGGATGDDRHFVIGGSDEHLSGATEGMETICIAEGVATAEHPRGDRIPRGRRFQCQQTGTGCGTDQREAPRRIHHGLCRQRRRDRGPREGKPRHRGRDQGGSICRSLYRNPASTRGEISGLQRFGQ